MFQEMKLGKKYTLLCIATSNDLTDMLKCVIDPVTEESLLHAEIVNYIYQIHSKRIFFHCRITID